MKILSNNLSGKYYKNVVQQKEPLHTLNNMRIEFVVTLINKANDNVALICQQFYVPFFVKELSLNQNATSTNETYIQVNKTNNQIVS